VLSINNDLKKGALDSVRLRKAFDKHFPDFKALLDKIEPLSDDEKSTVKPERKADDMAAETLSLVRQLVQQPTATSLPPTADKSARLAGLLEFDLLLKKIPLIRGRQETIIETLPEWRSLHVEVERLVQYLDSMISLTLRDAITHLGLECLNMDTVPQRLRGSKMEEIQQRATDLRKHLVGALNLSTRAGE
jgi:hypothetical protein